MDNNMNSMNMNAMNTMEGMPSMPSHDMNASMSNMNMHGSSMIFGMPLVTFLFFASAVVYAICAGLLWKPVRQEKNELISALFAFFVYQTVSMVFMALQMETMNLLYSSISSLAVFIGSVFMLRFLYSSRPDNTRRILFVASLIIVLALFIWFTKTSAREMMLANFTLWYDMVVNGVLVGGSIIYIGLRAKANWARIKVIGGGTGVISCCVVSNAAMLTGAVVASSAFQFLAPVVIVSSLSIARKKQANQNNQEASATTA